VTSTTGPATRLGTKQVEVGWMAVQWPSFEHVIASSGPAGFTADSWMILVSEAGLARVSYRLTCDSRWQVTELMTTVTDAASDRTLALSRDPEGHWHADGNRPLPELDGCIDVDINRSPLTNTLPIRRLDLGIGESRDLDVVYVSVPELTVRPVQQRYTLLTGDGPVYRYESGSFSADLPVDGDGVVIDYPGLWRRIGPGYGCAGDEESRS
jgi:uncharacterized protein